MEIKNDCDWLVQKSRCTCTGGGFFFLLNGSVLEISWLREGLTTASVLEHTRTGAGSRLWVLGTTVQTQYLVFPSRTQVSWSVSVSVSVSALWVWSFLSWCTFIFLMHLNGFMLQCPHPPPPPSHPHNDFCQSQMLVQSSDWSCRHWGCSDCWPVLVAAAASVMMKM